MLKENSKIVFNYVKDHEDENITAADIAAATGLDVKQVNGIVTAAFQRKGLMERVLSEIEVPGENGVSHKEVKFIKLTAEGREFDPEAPDTKA